MATKRQSREQIRAKRERQKAKKEKQAALIKSLLNKKFDWPGNGAASQTCEPGPWPEDNSELIIAEYRRQRTSERERLFRKFGGL